MIVARWKGSYCNKFIVVNGELVMKVWVDVTNPIANRPFSECTILVTDAKRVASFPRFAYKSLDVNKLYDHLNSIARLSFTDVDESFPAINIYEFDRAWADVLGYMRREAIG